jgi:hypothetical protein
VISNLFICGCIFYESIAAMAFIHTLAVSFLVLFFCFRFADRAFAALAARALALGVPGNCLRCWLCLRLAIFS